MRVALLLSVFPKYSETFIRSHVDFLKKKNWLVKIFCEYDIRHSDANMFANEVHSFGNLDTSSIYKIICFPFLFLQSFIKNPRQSIMSVNIFRYKQESYTGRIFFKCRSLFGKRYSFDVIHAHFGREGIVAQFLRDTNILSGKLVVTFHGYDLSQYSQRYGSRCYDLLASKADLVLPVSNYFKERLLQMGFDSERVQTHHMGVKLPCNFHRNIYSENLIRILSVARFTPKKGLFDAIFVMSLLKEKGVHFHYTIIGNGLLFKKIVKLVRRLNLNDCVELLGSMDHNKVLVQMANSDVFFLPSKKASNGDEEGIPLSVMEALALHVPVVTTAHAGIPEIIEDGVNGMLCLEGNVAGMAEAIIRLINDRELAEKISMEGAKVIQLNFNEKHLLDVLEKYYLRLV